MRIIEWPDFLMETSPFGSKPSAATVGVFDGVHLGHKLLVEKIVSYNKTALPVVFVFRHSRYKKKGGKVSPDDIQSIRQKMAFFEKFGAAAAVVIDFSDSVRHIPGTDFLKILMDRGKMRFLAVGSDFRCGYHAGTDAVSSKEFCAASGVETAIIEPLTHGSKVISSSQIRGAIARGNLAEAVEMLGHPFAADLGGVAVFRDGSGSVYNLTEAGRMLPPSGKYGVLLRGIKGGKAVSEPAEIFVKAGTLRIEGSFCDTGASWEYAEFLP